MGAVPAHLLGARVFVGSRRICADEIVVHGVDGPLRSPAPWVAGSPEIDDAHFPRESDENIARQLVRRGRFTARRGGLASTAEAEGQMFGLEVVTRNAPKTPFA